MGHNQTEGLQKSNHLYSKNDLREATFRASKDIDYETIRKFPSSVVDHLRKLKKEASVVISSRGQLESLSKDIESYNNSQFNRRLFILKLV